MTHPVIYIALIDAVLRVPGKRKPPFFPSSFPFAHFVVVVALTGTKLWALLWAVL